MLVNDTLFCTIFAILRQTHRKYVKNHRSSDFFILDFRCLLLLMTLM